MDCQTSLGFSAFLAKQREKGRQLKAGLQQVALLMLMGTKEYLVPTAVTVRYVYAKSRSEGISWQCWEAGTGIKLVVRWVCLGVFFPPLIGTF